MEYLPRRSQNDSKRHFDLFFSSQCSLLQQFTDKYCQITSCDFSSATVCHTFNLTIIQTMFRQCKLIYSTEIIEHFLFKAFLCEDCSLSDDKKSWSFGLCTRFARNLWATVSSVKTGREPRRNLQGESFTSHYTISTSTSNSLSECYSPVLWPQSEPDESRGGFNVKKLCLTRPWKL